MNAAVIYARYSSHTQQETSIEAQLKHCRQYAEENGLSVIGEYVDRAKTGTEAGNRTDFQRMITDAETETFNTILVYQYDRFSRSKLDSVLYKSRLKELGVRVVSIREPISDDAAGQLLESVLEGLNAYFSADLSQKIRRGVRVSAERALYNGGTVPFGLKVGADRHFELDEDTAPIVKHIFECYVNGATIKQILEELNAMGVKTQKNRPFAPNSLQKLLRNPKYYGVYRHGDIVILNGIPPIISEETFMAAQRKIEAKKRAPSSSGRFLLTTKLYCGRCGSMMVGDSGTDKAKRTHYYYSCKKARKGNCSRKAVRKEYIESLVISECVSILTDENIERIAKKVSDLNSQDSSSVYIKNLKKELAATQSAIDNLMTALEKGEEADLILDRIKSNRNKQRALEAQIAKEELTETMLTEPEIKRFLTNLRETGDSKENYRKSLIATLVKKIYLYDDKLTIFFVAADGEFEISKELQEDALVKGVRMGCTALHHT